MIQVYRGQELSKPSDSFKKILHKKEFWSLFYSFKLVKDRYSFIAPFYSFLAKLIFGNDLKELKTQFVANLEQKKILIIGGGDGLDYWDFQADLSGEYWEISEAMLGKAKKKSCAK